MIRIKAPAKINWYLRVLGKRRDGFHDIASLIQGVSLYDEISFEAHKDVTVVTEAPIPYEQNLAYRAAMLLKTEVGAEQGARITLKKNIPLEAGLGGGSSDAATTLMGLNKMWKLGLPDVVLSSLAGRLGSDVPFFINGPAAVVSGRGEKVKAVDMQSSVTLLLMKPSMGVSSAWAYERVRKYSEPKKGLAKKVRSAIESGDFSGLANLASNDLESPVVKRHPEVARLKACALEAGALFALMSGSGPTVLAVFKGRKAAEAAAARCKPSWWAVAKTLVK